MINIKQLLLLTIVWNTLAWFNLKKVEWEHFLAEVPGEIMRFAIKVGFQLSPSL